MSCLNIEIKRYFFKYIRLILLSADIFIVFFLAAGCSVPDKNTSQVVEIPDTFSHSGNDKLTDKWWIVFGDEKLNSLVKNVLHSNLNLKIAWQRLREAQAVVKRESVDLYPTISGFADAEKNWYSSRETKDIRLGLLADYEVDLWGSIRSNIEAQKYQAKATYTDYQTVALSLSAETVRTYFQLIEANNQLDLVNKQIQTNQQIVYLLKSRFNSGQIRSADILRQEQLLESTREQKITVESRIQVLEHRLAVIMGKPPQLRNDYVYKDLPKLPPLPRTGIPIELVRRRPDIRTEFNLLKVADSMIAEAISNQYPRLNLTASIYTVDDDAVDLFDDWVGSFVGSFVDPLLDAGRREAEVVRTQAVKNQQLYNYGQAVLTAFKEVEDALILEMKQHEQLESLKKQASLAKKTLNRLKHQYLNGTVNYIDVLTALNSEQQLRRDLISQKLILFEFRIALYRSLAGGFETEREQNI